MALATAPRARAKARARARTGRYRSSIAASLLRASAFADVSDLIGGYQARLAA